jgi:hypothetical protein
MTAPGSKQGALSADDIQAIWVGATDPGYSEPLVAAGEGAGFEAWTQMFQVFARVSEAVDVTTQALYILPGSGQTNPPASRAEFAQVELSVSRGTSYAVWPTVLVAGQVLVGEVAQDWGPLPGAAGVEVATGRLYALLETLVLPPGDCGPYEVLAQAVAPGYGYNNPLPGTISDIQQPGTGYMNTGASVLVVANAAPGIGGASNRASLLARNAPDMFLPAQVGQYVAFTAGANSGAVARIAGYVPVDPVADVGSGVILAWDQCVEVDAASGTFQPGELLLFASGATLEAVGSLLAATPGGAGLRVTYELLNGATPVGGWTVTGVTSTAAATVATVLDGQTYVAETGTAAWRVLDWSSDLQVAVANEQSPEGGLSAMLDELGSERAIPAGAGEDSDVYRKRVAQVADTVSPNAIRRALSKAMGMLPWCFREVGDPVFLPGIFFDASDFYDTNCLIMSFSFAPSFLSDGEPVQWLDAGGSLIAHGWVATQLPVGTSIVFVLRSMRDPIRTSFEAGDVLVSEVSGDFEAITAITDPACREGLREHVWLDYLRMRAYFQVGLPPGDDGEFGFFYDTFPLSHVGGFYDENVTGRNFYDGFPVNTYALRRKIWQDIERVRVGGVYWDLYVEKVGCP